MPEALPVDALVAALQAQRAVLGDAAVDFAIAALREKATPAAPAAPKLRQVSVLFCDIVESTAMLQRLATEDALTTVGDAVQRFAAIVDRAGGKVLRFTGDGLKAAFGSERSREDDAERAVRAGLAILAEAQAHAARLRRLGIDGFAVRVGINTGPVLLGAGAEADRGAMGHAVHIAARLEQSAPVGRLRIAHGTQALVRGLFEVQAQPPLAVKGSDEPLLTYLVDGVAVGGARQRGIDGVRPALIGRDDELARLLALVDAAARDGCLRAATVLGDAGLGKTRLLDELRLRLPRSSSVLLARAHPTSPLQPYGLLRDLLARWLGIADDDSGDNARAKLVAGLLPHAGSDGEAAAHRIGQLIGLDFPDSPHAKGLEGRELRDRAFRALRRVLQQLARSAQPAPLLLLLDDLHWADDGSLDFVSQLVDTDAPIALIALARPALLERRPTWMDGVAGHEALPLAALDAAQGQALATALLQRLPDAPASLHQLLVARAEGNPFYMEELLRMLIDDGVVVVDGDRWSWHAQRLAQLRVPPTLVGVLQARLDALPAADLGALQQASIVGPLFWDQALAALDAAAPQALPALQRRTLIQPRPESVFEQCREFGFHHQLLHDVTYATVLKAARREGHARAARWLAERVGERAPEFLAVAAEHYERAGDSAQALECYDRASLHAKRRFAHEAARVYTERALAQPALDSDPQRRYWLLCRRQQIADRQGASALAQQALDEQAAFADAIDDDALRADALAVRALLADRLGKPAESTALAQQAVLLAERTQAAPAAALAHGTLAWLAVVDCDFAAAAHHVEAGVPWARRAAEWPRGRGGFGGYELQLRFVETESLIAQGRLVDAAAALERAVALLATGTGIDRLSLLTRRAKVARELGDLAAAEEAAGAALALARELDMPRYQAMAQNDLAEIAELGGDALAQRRWAVAAHEAALSAGADQARALALAIEGSAWQRLGDGATARARLRQALALHRAARRGQGEADALARLAEVELAGGDLPAALRCVDELLAAAAAETLSAEDRHRCWRVLEHAGDARAARLLEVLHGRLSRLLAQVPDADGRRRMVERLPHWREVDRETGGTRAQ